MPAHPKMTIDPDRGASLLRLSGAWVIGAGHELEQAAAGLRNATSGVGRIVVDLSQVSRLDTAGAWVIDREMKTLKAAGADIGVEGAAPDHLTLLKEAGYRRFETPDAKPHYMLVDIFADIGRSVVFAWRDFVAGVSFLGELVAAVVASLVNWRKLRGTSVVFHLEAIAFRSVPIIALINFLVGCIVAQQGIFQLQRFGASTFAVDLIGILVLRELAVLLTSIMIAGRSGSAITAELGSMKMREEIDALTVMGLNPIEVLIAPRMLALIIALPLLTFLADMSAIFGGLIVASIYGGISPEIYMSRLQSAIALNTFLVGLIKAPFMALVIGLIASIEGLAVQGSAESLGRQVTSSVVKSIFMVIVVDGLFAMFFAAIRY
jgi:phospholipid/cholesterol/gamma-HCH transport system permease protein